MTIEIIDDPKTYTEKMWEGKCNNRECPHNPYMHTHKLKNNIHKLCSNCTHELSFVSEAIRYDIYLDKFIISTCFSCKKCDESVGYVFFNKDLGKKETFTLYGYYLEFDFIISDRMSTEDFVEKNKENIDSIVNEFRMALVKDVLTMQIKKALSGCNTIKYEMTKKYFHVNTFIDDK